MSDHISLRIALLDKQIVDCNGLPIGRVDDLELEIPETQRLRVVALLTGQQALGDRLGGPLGRLLRATAARLSDEPDAGPPRIDATTVTQLEPMVQLDRPFDALPGVAGLERWLARRLIEPLPGAGNASD